MPLILYAGDRRAFTKLGPRRRGILLSALWAVSYTHLDVYKRQVYGNGRVSDDGRVFGNAKIGFNAYISSPRSYFVQGPIGSRNDFLTCYLDKDKKIYAVTGCFCGSIEVFVKKVKAVHGMNRWAKQYLKAAEMARVMPVSYTHLDVYKRQNW